MKFSEVCSGTHEIYGGQRGSTGPAGGGQAAQRHKAGGAFQVRSNSPIVFCPGGFETVPAKSWREGE